MSDTIDIRILGCGSSGGVPRVGGPGGAGDWGACDPTNPKNRRRRCSILVRRRSAAGETVVLVDTAPDLREQLIDARVSHLDGILISHDHADQLHGIDDVRALVQVQRRRIDLYADAINLRGVTTRFGYIFARAEGSGYPPILDAHVLAEPFSAFAIEGAGGPVPVLPFTQQHGHICSLGFRFGRFAYSADVSALSDASLAQLEGLDLWVVDALRYAPHFSHANVETALRWISQVKPRHAVLTNLHVDLDYAQLKAELPAGVEPAYDGMELHARL